MKQFCFNILNLNVEGFKNFKVFQRPNSFYFNSALIPLSCRTLVELYCSGNLECHLIVKDCCLFSSRKKTRIWSIRSSLLMTPMMCMMGVLGGSKSKFIFNHIKSNFLYRQHCLICQAADKLLRRYSELNHPVGLSILLLYDPRG